MAPHPQAAAVFPASCFGKLPAFGDFVRCNAAGRDILAFDQWLQQGMHHARVQLRGEWDDSFRRSPAYRFLFFPENSESFLLGALWPSHDRSERRFPFIVSLRIDRRLPAEMLPLAPAVFAPFLDAAHALMPSLAHGMTLQDVAEATERLHAPVAQDYDAVLRAYESHLASTRIDELWRRLWGRADDERVFLVFKNLVDVLSPLRGRNPERLALGFRFPVSADGAELAFTVGFWLDVTYRIVGSRSARPFLFWTAPPVHDVASSGGNGTSPASPARPHLFVFLRQPTARSLLHLLRPDIDADFICETDLDGIDRVRDARSTLPPWIDAVLSAPETSLARLLEIIGARCAEPILRPGMPC